MKYTLITGRVIDRTFTPRTQRFIRRLEGILSLEEFIVLMYSSENPVLDARGSTGWVTQAVFNDEERHTAYVIMQDMLMRREHTKEALDRMLETYTLTCPKFAEMHGMTSQGVRNAIESHKLDAKWQDGQYWLRPDALFKKSAAGRPSN